MVVKGSSEWKKLNREMKILQAKRKAGGLLPKEAQRLEWLEQRFGEANEVTRIRLQEDVDDGAPKRLTSDDHWATEVSEDLLDDADNFEAQKAWDKDIPKEEAKFKATDSRQGKETFAQKGLSPFAIDLSADFKDEGFQDEPVEEEESAEKRATFGRVNYAKMDDEEEEEVTGGANPFAMSLDASLAGALGQFDDGSSVVPSGAAKSFDADYGDDFEDEDPVDFTTRVDDAPGEVQSLFERGEADTDGALSHGELTTHDAGEDAVDDEVDYDLMKAAMDYAEDHNLEDEEVVTWGVDDHGQEVEYQEEDDFELPTKSEIPSARLSSGALIPDPPPEQYDEEPRIVGEDGLGVLVPDPPEMTMDPGAAPVPDLFAEPEPTVTDETDSGLFEANAEAIPDLSSAEAIPDLSDGDVPDLSDGNDVPDLGADLDFSAEAAAPKMNAPYVPPPVPEDDLAYMPEAMPGGGSDPFAAEIDLSEASVAEADPFPDMESPPGGGQAGDQMDSFWGLSADEAPDDVEIETEIDADVDIDFGTDFDIDDGGSPATRMDPIPTPASPLPPPISPLPPPGRPLPPPSSAQPDATANRPLPALNLAAARVAPPPPPPPRAVAPAQQDPQRDQATRMLHNLFEEAAPEEVPDDSPVPMEPIIIGPVKKGAPAQSQRAQRPLVGRGVSRQAATQANDLSGPRRATVHFKDGVNRRGMIKKIDHHSTTLVLEPLPGAPGKAEKINTLSLKAVFLLLPQGVTYPQKNGYPCKLMMIDGRKLDGFTPDYDPQANSFTLFPAQDKGNVERVVVFNEAIKNLWFPEE